MKSKNWWDESIFKKKLPELKKRTRIIAAVRRFFEREGFWEVDTPALQVSPGLEVHLQAFATRFTPITANEKEHDLYLHTSPEFAMKKLLAAGMEKIYQIAHVFRNGEKSYLHHPEFLLLEWYRTGCDYQTLMQDTQEILRLALEAAGSSCFAFKDKKADLQNGIRIITVEEAFLETCGFSILSTIDDPLAPAAAPLFEKAKKLNVNARAENTWDDLFFKIMGRYIEPSLGSGRPAILCEYPVHMAALARPKPDDPKVAERFEMFVCGVELCNAFSEMCDATTQRARFTADMEEKARLYGSAYPIDEEFLQAMAQMPPCAGNALGLERLIMLASHAQHIENVIFAPVF